MSGGEWWLADRPHRHGEWLLPGTAADWDPFEYPAWTPVAAWGRLAAREHANPVLHPETPSAPLPALLSSPAILSSPAPPLQDLGERRAAADEVLSGLREAEARLSAVRAELSEQDAERSAVLVTQRNKRTTLRARQGELARLRAAPDPLAAEPELRRELAALQATAMRQVGGPLGGPGEGGCWGSGARRYVAQPLLVPAVLRGASRAAAAAQS